MNLLCSICKSSTLSTFYFQSSILGHHFSILSLKYPSTVTCVQASSHRPEWPLQYFTVYQFDTVFTLIHKNLGKVPKKTESAEKEPEKGESSCKKEPKQIDERKVPKKTLKNIFFHCYCVACAGYVVYVNIKCTRNRFYWPLQCDSTDHYYADRWRLLRRPR